jgi:hypothetical protein
LFTPVYGMHGLLPSQGELYRDVMLMMDEWMDACHQQRQQFINWQKKNQLVN